MIKIILFIFIGYNQLTGQLFEDITDQSGTAVYRPQYSFFGAGATMADFDQDGYIDVFVATPNGEALKVFHNLGDDTFEEVEKIHPSSDYFYSDVLDRDGKASARGFNLI